MSEGDFFRLAETRVAVVGLGLIGGSLALALRPHCAALLGADPAPQARAWAQRHALFDAVAADPAAIVGQADLILLAAPVRVILSLLPQLPRWTHQPAVVLDVGSVKGALAEALGALPPPLSAVGGHPMAGKAVGGAEHAEATLFQGAPFALVELPNTTPQARALALEVVAAIGAHPIWVEAEAHDQAVAAISHLPYLLAAALALATPPEAAPLIGPGFRSTSRLAASPPALMADILRHNLPAVRQALARYRQALAEVEAALDQPERLYAVLERSQAAHVHLLTLRGNAASGLPSDGAAKT